MASPTKDRITCHVLDTTTGRPARGLRVRLEGRAASPGTVLLGGGGSSAPRTFESLTDEDGRIRAWLPYSSETASGEVPVYTLDDVLADADEQQAGAVVDSDGDGEKNENGNKDKGKDNDAQESSTTWTLRFDSEAYFASAGKSTFFPEVIVSFRVKAAEHFHVPLLLSQYSYTTYRGS